MTAEVGAINLDLAFKLLGRGFDGKRLPQLVAALGYKPPAPAAVLWPAAPSGLPSPATPAVAAKPVMH